jgi:hypothetical protein
MKRRKQRTTEEGTRASKKLCKYRGTTGQHGLSLGGRREGFLSWADNHGGAAHDRNLSLGGLLSRGVIPVIGWRGELPDPPSPVLRVQGRP